MLRLIKKLFLLLLLLGGLLILAQTVSTAPLTLPTEEERLAMVVAFQNFELDKVIEYHTRVRDYWLAEVNKPFDVKKFSEGRKQITGAPPSAYEISGARGISESFKSQFRVYAAEPEDVLGIIEMLKLNYSTAADHFRKAIEMAPHYQKYRIHLTEAEASIARDKK